MTDYDSIIFYQRRIEQELRWAERACVPEAARIHLELAACYRARMNDLVNDGNLQVVQPIEHISIHG